MPRRIADRRQAHAVRGRAENARHDRSAAYRRPFQHCRADAGTGGRFARSFSIDTHRDAFGRAISVAGATATNCSRAVPRACCATGRALRARRRGAARHRRPMAMRSPFCASARARDSFLAAIGGLCGHCSSDYSRLRKDAGLSRYDEAAMLNKLSRGRVSRPARQPNNIGHLQTRMTFLARQRAAFSLMI